jgi:nicotinamidase-related amidase
MRIFYLLFLFFCNAALGQTTGYGYMGYGPPTQACDKNSNKPALVVIDMQSYFVKRTGTHNDPTNVYKINRIISEQLKAIEQAKDAKIPIIFIEYSVRGQNLGETDGALKAAVSNYKDAVFIKKDADSMLSNRNSNRNELVQYLKNKNIGKLIITGANGGACVFQSIEDSLDIGCKVVSYSPGIADFNYKDFIYPFTGEYNSFKSKCANQLCNFEETSSLVTLTSHMISFDKESKKQPSAQTGGVE